MEKSALAQEKVWFDKPSYDKAERLYFERMAKGIQKTTSPFPPVRGRLTYEVMKARQHIKQCMDDIAAYAGLPIANKKDTFDVDNIEAFADLLNDNKKETFDPNFLQSLKDTIDKLKERVNDIEDKVALLSTPSVIAVCPAKPEPVSKQSQEKADNEDDVDLFGSDSEGEDAEAAKIREERLAAYAAKKSKKPALIAKSNIILDVKPWDDETNMKDMETEVRKIEIDGLLWGAAKLVPLAFGIQKLQISCVVEDDKVSVDWLTEKIQEIEDYVQSVDIAAFNKV